MLKALNIKRWVKFKSLKNSKTGQFHAEAIIRLRFFLIGCVEFICMARHFDTSSDILFSKVSLGANI